jgi:hypothetical protein
MCTFSITFGPKVITIYKDASGFLAQRVSDSKASASELSRNPGTRTIKELAQQPIRLMDRATLRMYAALLEKELSAARAALATLDANEGVLAGGGGHIMAQQHASQVRTVSGLGNTGGGAGSNGLLARPPAGTPPGSTARLMTTGPAGNQGFTPNNNSPRSRAGSVYKYPGANGTTNGNGGPRASSPNPPNMVRTASVAPAPLIPPPPNSMPSPSLQSSAAEYKTPTPIPGNIISPTNASLFASGTEGHPTPTSSYAPPQRTTSSGGLNLGAASGSETRFRMPFASPSIPTSGGPLTARGALTVQVNGGDLPSANGTNNTANHGNAWRAGTDRLAQLRAVDGPGPAHGSLAASSSNAMTNHTSAESPPTGALPHVGSQ